MKLSVVGGLFLGLLFCGCSNKFDKVSEEKFIGQWEVKGRKIFEGIQIKIEREDKKLVGRISKLNNNKLVRMFADSSDVWVSEINRSSNFQFQLTEKKIAKDLFSLYGISSSKEFKAEFIDENTIGLATDNSDPVTSSIIYKRVVN